MTDTLQLPRTLKLTDGSEVTLRLLGRLDRETFLRFTQSLPDHDLLFLRIDITDPDVIDTWLDNIDLERIITIVAEREGKILGYGSLHMANARWSEHVGELRVLIDGSLRGKGLVRTLNSSASCSSPSGSRVRRSPSATSTSMISASGVSNAGPGSRRDHTSSSRFRAGVAKRP